MATKAAAFKRSTFATIYQLTRKAEAPDTHVDASEISRVMDFFDRVTPEDATALAQRWRRNPEYLDAQRLVHGDG